MTTPMTSDSEGNKLWKWLNKKRYIYKPYLEFYLDIGFVRLRTSVMHRAYERDVYDYIRLDWKLFKWSGGFNLYKPGADIR